MSKTNWENIQLSLPEPPVTPFTSVAPLVFVVVVTMIKQVGQKNMKRVVFSLVPPNFSTKKKTASQPIGAAVPIKPVTKKGHDWLLGGFSFWYWNWGYQWKNHPVYLKRLNPKYLQIGIIFIVTDWFKEGVWFSGLWRFSETQGRPGDQHC